MAAFLLHCSVVKYSELGLTKNLIREVPNLNEILCYVSMTALSHMIDISLTGYNSHAWF